MPHCCQLFHLMDFFKKTSRRETPLNSSGEGRDLSPRVHLFSHHLVKTSMHVSVVTQNKQGTKDYRFEKVL